MNDRIHKINNLKKTDGFLQVDFLKGFKYVDKAGEFMNAISTVDNIPDHAMSPEGMTVNLNKKTELKVSPNQLWMHFAEPVSFDEQKKEFLKKLLLVDRMFEPEKYQRVGWRNFFVYENGIVPVQVIPSDILAGGTFSEVLFTKNIAGFDSRIKLSAVKNKESGIRGILFDMDIYKKFSTSREEDPIGKIKGMLESIGRAFDSEELRELINTLLT